MAEDNHAIAIGAFQRVEGNCVRIPGKERLERKLCARHDLYADWGAFRVFQLLVKILKEDLKTYLFCMKGCSGFKNCDRLPVFGGLRRSKRLVQTHPLRELLFKFTL